MSSDETSVITNGKADYAGASVVTPELFGVFGVTPKQGRLFTLDEERHGAPAEAVVSPVFWRERFGSKRFEGHETVSVEGRSFSVIGIMPEGFDFPKGTAIWMPPWIWPENRERSSGFAFVVARLKPDVSVAAAQAQMETIGRRLSAAYPGSNRTKGFIITPLRSQMVADIRVTLNVLFGAVALVLLIACSNVANLLLARATARSREIGIRLALGASRARAVRELAVENLMLALLACVLGILLAQWGVAGLRALAPKNLPRLDEIHVDGWVLLFGLVVSLIASLLAGLGPAWRTARVDPNEALAQSGRRGVVGGPGAGIRNLLVVAEIALAVVLVVSAGLLIRSFSATTAVNPGFNPEHLLVAEASLPGIFDENGNRQERTYFEPLLERISQRPGVVSAAAVNGTPMGTGGSNGSYIVEGQTTNDFTTSSPQAEFTAASPSYFRTMQIPVVSGRAFDARDSFEAPSTAIISAKLARQAFAHLDPIGRKILCGWDLRTTKWMTIVGVVADVHTDSLTGPIMPVIYVPVEQHPQSFSQLVIRTGGEPMRLSPVIRNLSHALDPLASIRMNTMANIIGGSIAAARFRMLLLALFAAVALILAAAGVYGVMAYVVTQRTAEIGIRMAVGAEQSTIMRMIFLQVARLGFFGAVLGFAGSIAASRLITSLLFNVKPGDPATYVLMLAVLGAAALIAGFVPAYRASRIDPIQALREE